MIFLIASFVFVLDRLAKIAVVGNMAYGQSIDVLPGIFNLTLTLNSGTAFGLLKGQNTLLAVFSALAAAVIVIYAVTHKGAGIAITFALGLILGGALGNLFDRVRFGRVIDFLDFHIWPVFNIADSAITIGAVLLAWNILIPKRRVSS